MSVDLLTPADVYAQLQSALALIARHEQELARRDAQIAEMASIGAYREARIEALTTQIAQLLRHRFGRRAEQLGLPRRDRDPAGRLPRLAPRRHRAPAARGIPLTPGSRTRAW